MGLRFSKSIKLPFGLRLNLSKSGIGFSWGVKGFRVSKSAKGRVRKTVTVPGTGLSYVKEESSNKKEIKKNVPSTQESNGTKLKEVYLNEETGEIIEKSNSKVKEVKTFDDVVDNLANNIGDMFDK